jgi:hypothetical protein
MRFKLNGKDYRVFFTHHNPAQDAVGGTLASIESADENDENFECYEGYAQLHPSDNFCKETGRKLALARALENSGWRRAERQVVWLEYFGRALKTAAIAEQIKKQTLLDQIFRPDEYVQTN